MIVFAHLLNDRSGSPRVLKDAIEALTKDGRRAMLYVGTDGEGVLSGCSVPTKKYWYRRTGNRFATLFTYFFSQIDLFLKLFLNRDIERDALIYVNTLLPFGAALYGWASGRKVIYHIHEISVTPAPLRWLLVGLAKLTSRLNIYVSDAHLRELPISGVPALRVYNALNFGFAASAAASVYQQRREDTFVVLMIASLRDYKGVPEYVELADMLSERKDVRFVLVVNDGDESIRRYFSGRRLPANLEVHGRTEDPAQFYAMASAVLNLSRSDQCVETFGLTILEAMAFGIPVIVPPVGGPAELVSDGVEGYQIDSRHIDRLAEKIRQLADSPALCQRISSAAREKASLFSHDVFAQNLCAAIETGIAESSRA